MKERSQDLKEEKEMFENFNKQWEQDSAARQPVKMSD